MKSVLAIAAIVVFASLSSFAGEEQNQPAAADPAPAAKPGGKPEMVARPILVLFDLESQGDDGELGKWVTANIRAKLFRKNTYIMVEEMDVTQAIENTNFAVKHGTPLKNVIDFATKRFAADIAVWGKAELKGQKIVMSVKAIALKDDPELLVDDVFAAENRNVTSEAANEFVRRLTGEEKAKEYVDPAWATAWSDGPNLVKNPGFEETDGDHPAGWDPWGKDYHHGMVEWVDAPGPDGRGKCIKITMDETIAGTYGVGYYGDPIDISGGTRYRFSIRVWSGAPTIKIFLKHYAWFPAKGNEKEGQWRVTRDAPLNCRGAGPQWKEFVRDFSPHRDDAYDPKQTRIELYAYWPAGTVYFDDVVMKKIE